MMAELTLHVHDDADGEDRRFLLRQSCAIIGTGRDSDVDLPDLDLGLPCRFYLQAVSQGVASVNLMETGMQDRRRPAQATLLGTGKYLQVGSYSVTAELRNSRGLPVPGGTRDHPPSRLPNRPHAGMRLQFINAQSREKKKATRILYETLTLIGSCNRCHIKLSDSGIPDFQSSIVRLGDEVWVHSLTREFDLQVNGHVVRHARLLPGDILSIGPFLMQFQEDSAQRSSPESVSRETHLVKVPCKRTPPGTRESRSLSRNDNPNGVDAPFETKRESGSFNAELSNSSAEWDAMNCSADWDTVALVKQLATMHQILMEQSQLQTSLLIHLLHNAQSSHTVNQDLLREQIDAIQSIADELHAWKDESRQTTASTPVSQPGPLGLPYPYALLTAPPEQNELPEIPREPKSYKDIAAHASVSDRISVLERERNTLIQRIMRLLKNDASDDEI